MRCRQSTVAVSPFFQSPLSLSQTPWPSLEAGDSEEAVGTHTAPLMRQLRAFSSHLPWHEPTVSSPDWGVLARLGLRASTRSHAGDEATSPQPGACTGV